MYHLLKEKVMGTVKVLEGTCVNCKVKVQCQNGGESYQSLRSVRRNAVYCSLSCKEEYIGKLNSKRMKENNPMSKKETIEKMKSVKRVNGTLNVWNGTRGGNGHTTLEQESLAIALGWEIEVAIPTADHLPILKRREWSKSKKMPTCYKVDVGNKDLKIAIEIDGKGHLLKSNRMRDVRKTLFLNWKGWKVLRFTNEQIQRNLRGCVKMVLSTISK
jgi:hypothetical protein